MMAGACLAPWIALLLCATPDVGALVTRLGSDQAPERDEAAKALESAGRGALPALVEAARGATNRRSAPGRWNSGIESRGMR